MHFDNGFELYAYPFMFQLVSNVCFCFQIDFEAFGCVYILVLQHEGEDEQSCSCKIYMSKHVVLFSFLFSFLVLFSFLYYSIPIIDMMKSVVELVETPVSQLP